MTTFSDIPSKAYVVVDSALSSGAKLAQGGHALVELVRHEPALAKLWNEGPNVLIVLEADRYTLSEVEDQLTKSGAGVWPFWEPDFDYAMTAFAVFNEGDHVNVPLSALKLAQRNPGSRFSEWLKRRRENRLRGHEAGTVSVRLAS